MMMTMRQFSSAKDLSKRALMEYILSAKATEEPQKIARLQKFLQAASQGKLQDLFDLHLPANLSKEPQLADLQASFNEQAQYWQEQFDKGQFVKGDSQ